MEGYLADSYLWPEATGFLSRPQWPYNLLLGEVSTKDRNVGFSFYSESFAQSSPSTNLYSTQPKAANCKPACFHV